MTSILFGAFVLGLVAGARTFLAPAALWLTRGGIAGYVLAVVAVGELVVDLLPRTGARTRPPALAGRCISGAVVGWALCTFEGGSPVAGAVVGLIGALAGTYGGIALRSRLAAAAGAVPAALLEDALAIVLAIVTLTAIAPLPRA